MRVAAYVRVSSVVQVEDGHGLSIQQRAIERYCVEHGYEIVDTFEERGVSGSLADRPQLARMLAELGEGRADAVVVYRLDRLARSLLIQETIIAKLAEHDVRVLSVSESDVDSEDPTRILVRQVLGAIGQYERALINARLQAGRAAKAARGGYACGAPPLGYRAEGKELVPDDDGQAVVSRILELREERQSLRKIAAALDEDGIRPKRGIRWSPEAVRLVLRRAENGNGAGHAAGNGATVANSVP